MKNLLILAFIFLTVGYFSIPQQRTNLDIETIKQSPIPTPMLVSIVFSDLSRQGSTNIGEGIAKLAGIDGSAKWDSYVPEKYKEKGNIVAVQATVVCPSKSNPRRTAKFQFLLNKSSGVVEIAGFSVEGENKQLIDASLALQFGVI